MAADRGRPLGCAAEVRIVERIGSRSLSDEAFLIVDRDSLQILSDLASAIVGKGAAVETLETYLGEHPQARGKLHVVPEHEVLVS